MAELRFPYLSFLNASAWEYDAPITLLSVSLVMLVVELAYIELIQ